MLKRSQPVLIIDDSRAMCGIISKIANQMGFTDVDSVYDGFDGLVRLKKKSYGLVIVDWHMSPLTGPEVIEQIQADQALRNIAIVLMTADHQQVAAMVKSLNPYGAHVVILKPFTAEALSGKLTNAFPRWKD
jgi:two-component system chemotaxis response regulator CheY